VAPVGCAVRLSVVIFDVVVAFSSIESNEGGAVVIGTTFDVTLLPFNPCSSIGVAFTDQFPSMFVALLWVMFVLLL